MEPHVVTTGVNKSPGERPPFWWACSCQPERVYEASTYSAAERAATKHLRYPYGVGVWGRLLAWAYWLLLLSVLFFIIVFFINH